VKKTLLFVKTISEQLFIYYLISSSSYFTVCFLFVFFFLLSARKLKKSVRSRKFLSNNYYGGFEFPTAKIPLENWFHFRR